MIPKHSTLTVARPSDHWFAAITDQHERACGCVHGLAGFSAVVSCHSGRDLMEQMRMVITSCCTMANGFDQ